MRIVGWPSDISGCGHYRLGIPFWGLQQLGHSAEVALPLQPEHLDGLELLVGQRIVDEGRSELWQHLARHPGRDFAMVFEVDDDLWNVPATNPYHGYFANPRTQELLTANVRMADAVTVTNSHLAEVVSAYNPNVFVLPNCLDKSLLEFDAELAPGVGWAGGASHEHDFASVQAGLKSFARKNPHVPFTFVGMDYSALVGRDDARLIPGNNNLMNYIRSFDFTVGVAPIAPTHFNRSKSDVKVLEYAARGIVPVATDHGPYKESLVHGESGLLVKQPHEWGRHLKAITGDPEMVARLSVGAREWASTRTIQANVWRWDAAYASVAGQAIGSLSRPVSDIAS